MGTTVLITTTSNAYVYTVLENIILNLFIEDLLNYRIDHEPQEKCKNESFMYHFTTGLNGITKHLTQASIKSCKIKAPNKIFPHKASV